MGTPWGAARAEKSWPRPSPRRPGALLFALTLLAGCGRSDPAPFVESHPPPGLSQRFYPPENWAWGLLRVGDAPVQRYGVSAPAVVPRGAVLILPDYGESAEIWFETVRGLNDAGYTVWVLEGVGQGGSGHARGRRDLGDLQSFAPDVAIVRGMIAHVIRPEAPAKIAILGQGVGAWVAARAVEDGAPAAAVVLSAPDCRPLATGPTLRFLGLGIMRASGASWSEADAEASLRTRTHDRWRAEAAVAWALANPDLRMGGPSFDWLAAFAGLRNQTDSRLNAVRSPTLLLAPTTGRPCLAPPGAQRVDLPGARPALELEEDAYRRPWLAAIRAFLVKAMAPPKPGG